jgi:hypothetical protein
VQYVRHAELALQTRGINHRVGSFRFKELGAGQAGSPGNFLLRLVTSDTDFFSPRHRHNFDQVRVQIQGCFQFDADGSMAPGAIGYFPEGTDYGPQTSQEDTVQLVMQIGGPSGGGYLSEAQRTRAVAELAGLGEFRGGRYFAAGSDQGVDGFQAAWEHALGQPMAYPPQRLQRPLLVDPHAFDWLPSGHAGVQQKTIVDFGRRTVGVTLYRLAAGASLTLANALSCFVETGTGRVDWDLPGQAYDSFDTMHLAAGEHMTLNARSASTMIVFTHPVFAPAAEMATD